MNSLPPSLKSPSFWASIGAGVMAIAAGLTDTGNPTLIAIGGAVVAVHAIAEAVLNGIKSSQGGAGDKAAALMPILSEQIVNVQTLIKTVEDSAKIAAYKAKGYEVTPHVDETPTPTLDAKYVPATTLTSTMPGATHQVIGIPKA